MDLNNTIYITVNKKLMSTIPRQSSIAWMFAHVKHIAGDLP